MVVPLWKVLFAHPIPGYWAPLAFTAGTVLVGVAGEFYRWLNPGPVDGAREVNGFVWRFRAQRGELLTHPTPHCPACDLELELPRPEVRPYVGVVTPAFSQVPCQRPGCGHVVTLPAPTSFLPLVALARRVIEADLRKRRR